MTKENPIATLNDKDTNKLFYGAVSSIILDVKKIISQEATKLKIEREMEAD